MSDQYGAPRYKSTTYMQPDTRPARPNFGRSQRAATAVRESLDVGRRLEEEGKRVLAGEAEPSDNDRVMKQREKRVRAQAAVDQLLRLPGADRREAATVGENDTTTG